MAMYGSNDADAFFLSAMQELGQDVNMIDQDQEMEEVFSDAVEHQAQCDGPMDDYKSEFPDNTATSDDYNIAPSYLAPTQPTLFPEETTSEYIHTSVQNAQQGYTPLASNYPSHYTPRNEPKETINANTTSASEKYAAAYHNSIKRSLDTSQQQDQHASGCDGTRGASTPPTTPPPEATQSSDNEVKSEPKSEPKAEPKSDGKVWFGPDDLRDVPKAVLREKRWHEKVAHLHPRVPLASHRYWIGILNPDTKPKNASKEEHFTWMKGNRLTTVETVSRVYAATTMLEGVFMTGGERPELQDRMEELDLFNDKVVMFQVAEEGTSASVGRLITEGLVTKEIEVIELDD
jgi:hypothetical protein